MKESWSLAHFSPFFTFKWCLPKKVFYLSLYQNNSSGILPPHIYPAYIYEHHQRCTQQLYPGHLNVTCDIPSDKENSEHVIKCGWVSHPGVHFPLYDFRCSLTSWTGFLVMFHFLLIIAIRLEWVSKKPKNVLLHVLGCFFFCFFAPHFPFPPPRVTQSIPTEHSSFVNYCM
jgi:hypothetical protein